MGEGEGGGEGNGCELVRGENAATVRETRKTCGATLQWARSLELGPLEVPQKPSSFEVGEAGLWSYLIPRPSYTPAVCAKPRIVHTALHAS